MNHNVTLSFDLTNKHEANFYNMVRNLEGINNSVSGFKLYLRQLIIDAKEEHEKENLAGMLTYFEKSFSDNGITV
jgi:hypothetical protein